MKLMTHPLSCGLAAGALLVLTTLTALGVAQPAHAAIDCWMDAEHTQTGDGLRVTDARLAALREAVHMLNTTLHRQPELHALPRTRLRSSWQIGGQWNEPARGANFLLRDHRESMWSGPCGVIAGADRLEPKATVVARINVPTSFFETAHPELSDEQFQAWREVPASGQLQGRTLYGGHLLVFTRGGRLPWAPVSTADYVDFTLRDLHRRVQEDTQARSGLPALGDIAAREAFDEAQLQKVVQAMRQLDPVAAEKMAVEMRASQRAEREHEARVARRRAAAGVDPSPLQTMLRRVQAWRASLTPQQLAAQARLGLNGLHDPAVPVDRYPLLAKPDPDFPWDRQQPGRPQMLSVSVRGNENFEQPMQQVLQHLDLRALQALVD